MTRSRVEGPLFALLLLCYVWPFDLDPGANVLAHMDQAAAIVADRTLSIDAFMRAPMGPNTVDWARRPDGRFYPAKAPGPAFAAVPVLTVLHAGESAIGVDPLNGDWFRRNIILVNWVMNSLVSAMAMTLLFRVVVAAGISASAASFGVLAIALGTVYFPYATTYYGHNMAANLIVAAAYFGFATARRRGHDALAGLLSGFAVVFEYSSVLAVVVFAVALAAGRPRALLFFVAGGLIPLAVLTSYHTVVFGGPAVTGYRFINPAIAPPDGAFLRLPRASTLLSLSAGPYRGIFFYSPVLLLAVAGAWRASRAGRRPIAWIGLVLFSSWLLFNASYYVWWGGWTAGSRYMIPGLVLLAPAVALGFEAFPRMGASLLAVSIANHLAISAAAIVISDDVRNPLRDVVYPLAWQGDFQRSNLGVFLLGLHGVWSLAPLMLAAACLAIVLRRRAAEAARVGGV